MKRIMWSMLLGLGLLVCGAAADKSPIHKLKYPEMKSYTLPEVEKAELDNGMKLRLIKQDKLPMFQLSMMLRGGSAYDPLGKFGLMDVMAAVIRVGGTGKHSPDEIDQMLESGGISIGFRSGSDALTVTVSGLVEDFDRAIALAAELIRHPAFNAEKLDEVKTQTGSAISRRNDDPGQIAQREFQQLVYGKAFAAEGVMEYAHLDAIERKDLIAAHKRFFFPGNMLVGVSGPLTMKQVEETFATHFGDWQDKGTLPDLPRQIQSASDVRLAFAEKADLTQSYIYMGYLGDTWKADETAKVSVFNAIFSQGFDSRLFSRVRTKEGLTYGVGGSIGRNYLYPGITSYSTFTKSASTFKAIRAMQEEMQRMRQELVSPQELRDAKDYLLNSQVFKFSSPEQVLARKLNQEYYNLPADVDDAFVAMVKSVTAEDVRQIAEQYLHPEKMLIMVLGKEADLDDKLENWGPVKKIDYSIPPPPLKEVFPEITPESIQKGQELLAAAQKKGYRNYVKMLKSSRSVMDVTITMPQGKMQMKMTDSTRYPDFNHQQIEVMGMKIVNVITPKGGYGEQMGQRKAISAEQVAENRFARFYDLLVRPEGYQIQFLKADKLGDDPVDVMLIREENGSRWKKIYLHQKTGLLMAEESMMEIMGQGKKPARTVYGDYRQIKGLPFAHTIRIEAEGKPFMESKVSKVEVNPTLDDALFKID